MAYLPTRYATRATQAALTTVSQVCGDIQNAVTRNIKENYIVDFHAKELDHARSVLGQLYILERQKLAWAWRQELYTKLALYEHALCSLVPASS